MSNKRNNKLDFIKIKSFCVSKDTIKKMKRQNGRKYLQIIYLMRDLYPEYIKNSYNSIIKKRQIVQLKNGPGTSLVAQWLRIRLPMQGTQVRALVWEDPTCHGATKHVGHNY